MPQTTNSPDHEDHSENKLRRSKRVKGLPVPTYNLELLTTIGATSDETILSTPALVRPAVVSNKAPQSLNNGSSDASIKGGKRNKDEDRRQSKNSSHSNQDPGSATLTKSRKRKAATSSAPPPTKKQKVDSPTSTRQRKAAGKPKVKTAKEKFLAASAVDKRPLPWGEPEVWAEVWFPRRRISIVKANKEIQTRPELCEALPYFHCWQGAGHTHNGHVLAMLLDEDRGERAYMDEEIAIARA